MKTLFVLALALSALPALRASAAPSHPVLRAHLLTLLEEDHITAEETRTAPAIEPEAVRITRHDAHRAKLRAILQTHGWPGRDAVGEDGSQALLALLQEECSDRELLQLALPLLQAAVGRGVAALADLARLVDAARVGEGRMQLYGTQYRAAVDGRPVRFPIEDAGQADARRQLVGLPTLRAQEEAMGLLAPRPVVTSRSQAESKADWTTRLQTARGLNSVRYPRLRMIYVHSRDDARAPAGEHYAVPGLDMQTLPVPGPGQR